VVLRKKWQGISRRNTIKIFMFFCGGGGEKFFIEVL